MSSFVKLVFVPIQIKHFDFLN